VTVKMKDFRLHIYESCLTTTKGRIRVVAIFRSYCEVVLAGITFLPGVKKTHFINELLPFIFFGAFFSGLCRIMGMKIATKTNVEPLRLRTEFTAGIKVSFGGGTVMGLIRCCQFVVLA